MYKGDFYLYALDTMADWEYSYLMSEVHSKKHYKVGAQDFGSTIVIADSKEPIKTLGGLTVIPDKTINQVNITSQDILVLPGADQWQDEKHQRILEMVPDLLEQGTLVAAICGATLAIANKGILNQYNHTSNSKEYLTMFSEYYHGTSNYVEQRAVTDRNLVTASGMSPLEFTYEVLKNMDVFQNDTLESWYNLNKTAEPKFYYSLLKTME